MIRTLVLAGAVALLAPATAGAQTGGTAPSYPAPGIDWSIDSTPFAVKLGVENVLLCGYQRYITDDVAWFQLPMKVEQPTCKASSSSVRRGKALRLACNVSGKITVRFAGRRSKTLSGTLSTKDGSGKISTRSLRPGRYRVTVKTGEVQLGKTFTLRISK